MFTHPPLTITEMDILRYANMALAFGLELAMLAALGRWGYLQGKSALFSWLMAIGMVGIAVMLWGYFAAPRSAHRLPLLSRLGFELFMFLLSGLLLYTSGYRTAAVWFCALSCVSILLAFIFKE